MRSVFAAALMASTGLAATNLVLVPEAAAQDAETIRRVVVEGNQRIEDLSLIHI